MPSATFCLDFIRDMIIFSEADTSGDGSIDAQEFVEMLAKPSVGAIFKELELEVEEVVTLFIIVADEDGEADY